MSLSPSGLLRSLLLAAVFLPSPVRGEDGTPANVNKEATPSKQGVPGKEGAPGKEAASSKEGAPEKPAAEKPSAAEKAAADAAKEKLVELDRQLRKKPIPEAISTLDAAIAAEPANEALPARRLTIVRRLTADKQSEAAIEQGTRLLEFHQGRLDKPGATVGFFLAVQDLVTNYDRLGEKEKATSLLDASLQRVKELASEEEASPQVSAQGNATILFLRAKATRLSELQGYEAADAFLAEQCGQVDVAGAAESERFARLGTWSRLMEARIDVADSAEKKDVALKLVTELETPYLDALAKDDKSLDYLRDFIRIRAREVGRLNGDAPEAAQELFTKTLAFVDGSPLKDETAIVQTVKSFKTLEGRIESSLTARKLVGQPAPPFDVQAWAHGEPRPADSLKGKVILVDFWAIWCGPCIATFPHLIELHEKYHDKGLEIVGVTREYGYSWNAEEQQAESDKDDATLETEVEMLDRFMTHHKLRHATIVTPKTSTMYKEYGVSGIPHVAVIDRHGIVRLYKVGSGDANSKAIHDMIEKLLAE